ncbi:hypothetical protein, partial [Acidithiobacillus caldus]|uniref:hypothetical protein n=1 Tax=Acidithiobacillus caldus TaxID=33059 RepID=UPI000AF60C0C
MKQRALTLAVLFAVAQAAAASTLTITKPTTEPSSSLSSSTNLKFDASAGSSANLTINQGYTDVTSVGSVSMPTNGSIVLDTSDPADNSISFSGGSGAAPTGNGTLSLSGNTSTVDAAFSGDDPFSGSLDITASGQAGLFVGGNPQSTPVATNLNLSTLTMSTQTGSADIDVDSGSTLNIDKLIFEDTGANTASNSGNPCINITGSSTGTDNTVNIGSVSVDGSAGTGNNTLTLDDFENNGTGTFNIGNLTVGGVQAYTSQDYSNINMVLNLQNATVGSDGFLITNNSKSLVVNLGSSTNPGTIAGSSPNAVFQLENAVFNDYGGSIDMPSVVVAGDSQANLYGKSSITGNVSVSGAAPTGNGTLSLSGNLDNNGVVSALMHAGVAPSTPAILNISPNAAL